MRRKEGEGVGSGGREQGGWKGGGRWEEERRKEAGGRRKFSPLRTDQTFFLFLKVSYLRLWKETGFGIRRVGSKSASHQSVCWDLEGRGLASVSLVSSCIRRTPLPRPVVIERGPYVSWGTGGTGGPCGGPGGGPTSTDNSQEGPDAPPFLDVHPGPGVPCPFPGLWTPNLGVSTVSYAPPRASPLPCGHTQQTHSPRSTSALETLGIYICDVSANASILRGIIDLKLFNQWIHRERWSLPSRPCSWGTSAS